MAVHDNVKTAFYWDESFLWGIIARRTFLRLGIDFDLLTSEDIRGGALERYGILFVPGGWASDKIVALGDEGRRRVRDFVAGGGAYMGFCGGAGLALSHENGLALVDLERMPTSLRVPNFSGTIRLREEDPGHPLWQGVANDTVFHAWWPGQFRLTGDEEVSVLARYGSVGDDAFVSDLPALPEVEWSVWEKRYGMNLDPARLEGEPAVIEARFGEGKVLLSYLHFETPGDAEGHKVLLNALEYLAGGAEVRVGGNSRPTQPSDSSGLALAPGADAAACCCDPKGAARDNDVRFLATELRDSARKLIEFGMINHLWYQRNDWILQWRRGVRGVEYSTLYAMLDELANTTAGLYGFSDQTALKLRGLRDMAQLFFENAPRLLLLERDAISREAVSPLKTGDPQIRTLREHLFSSSRRCGGLYKQIVDLADEILLSLIR